MKMFIKDGIDHYLGEIGSGIGINQREKILEQFNTSLGGKLEILTSIKASKLTTKEGFPGVTFQQIVLGIGEKVDVHFIKFGTGKGASDYILECVNTDGDVIEIAERLNTKSIDRSQALAFASMLSEVFGTLPIREKAQPISTLENFGIYS